MNIVIAGAGEVGQHAAEVLGEGGHNVVVIDKSAAKLRDLEERLDVRTLQGNCSHAAALREAGGDKCDLLVAATNVDEVNLLTASIAKGLGARKCLARVHHGAYFDQHGIDYAKHLGIDQLICPEYLTSLAIARTLHNPGALAVEDFARGLVAMQEFPVEDDAPAVGTTLRDLKLPPGIRLAQISRDGSTFMPAASTVVSKGDIVTLIGERATFEQGRKLFASGTSKRIHVVVMGGSTLSVWVCRAMNDRHFSLRLFEIDRARAEELAEKLTHVTVVQADPTDQDVCEEERLGDADAFLAVTGDDERNILASAQAKSMGVAMAIAVVKRSTYLHLLSHVGIDKAFSPRTVAADAIRKLLEAGPVQCLATLSQGTADVYEIRPTRRAPVVGKELRNVKLPPDCMVAAIQRGDKVTVPGAEDIIDFGDTVLLIGPHKIERDLKKLFAGK